MRPEESSAAAAEAGARAAGAREAGAMAGVRAAVTEARARAEGGGGQGGGEGGGGEGGGGEGAVNTCVDVPTPLTAVICTPRLAESVVVLPCSSDSDDWAASSDGTRMVT